MEFLIGAVILVAVVYALTSIRHHGPSMFHARVSGAVFDLGITPLKMGSANNQVMMDMSLAEFRAKGKQANFHEVAVDFFLKMTLEKGAIRQKAQIHGAVLVRAVAVISQWGNAGKISGEKAEQAISQINYFVEEGLEQIEKQLGAVLAGDTSAEERQVAALPSPVSALSSLSDGAINKHSDWSFRKAAERSIAAVQTALGHGDERGVGIENSTETAGRFRKAVEHGHNDEQATLEARYGDGVTMDAREAARKCRNAAEQGYDDAQFHLGVCYSTGNGVVENLAEAVKWYRKAAEQGNDMARFLLGACYAEGFCIAKDPEAAVKWFRTAAGGDARGQGSTRGQAILKRLSKPNSASGR